MENVLGLAISEQDYDTKLVEQACAGDCSAFDVLFERHKTFIYNVCYRMLASEDDAIDAVQTSFIQAYNQIHRFRGESSFRTWLYRIAVNTCTEHLRREKRRRLLSVEIEPPHEREAPRDMVWEAILELPVDLKTILVLRYFQDLPCEDISQILGCTVSAARTRLHRAREAFKRKYKELQK